MVLSDTGVLNDEEMLTSDSSKVLSIESPGNSTEDSAGRTVVTSQLTLSVSE